MSGSKGRLSGVGGRFPVPLAKKNKPGERAVPHGYFGLPFPGCLLDIHGEWWHNGQAVKSERLYVVVLVGWWVVVVRRDEEGCIHWESVKSA